MSGGNDTGTGAGRGGETDTDAGSDPYPDLVEDLLAGKHRALARAITRIENRQPGYRDLVSELYGHAGDADVVGITGSPGAGKSTLVDKLAATYRERGLTVGVIAVDPSSPYTGGSVLGDRIRMSSNVGDMDVFVRSMSARGHLGGISTATTDAVTALDAFGKDVVIIETVGAGQNEIDIVRTADTVAVLVPPGSGDSVQTLKAGILEIGDVFVVNKADLEGADRTVSELREMIHLRDDTPPVLGGHHGADRHAVGGTSDGHRGGSHGSSDGRGSTHDSSDDSASTHHGSSDGHGTANGGAGTSDRPVHADEGSQDGEGDGAGEVWTPRIVETVATDGTGVDDLIQALAAHREHMAASGTLERKERQRVAEEIRMLLRDDASGLLEREIERHGGMSGLVDAVVARETDPYSVADRVIGPVRECVEREPEEPATTPEN